MGMEFALTFSYLGQKKNQMAFEIEGTLVEKFDTQRVNDNFQKREFVVEQKESRNGYEFQEFLKFQLVQDRCELINDFNTGDQIKVNFNIKGRKWEKDGKVNYFTNLEAWRIENSGGGAAPKQTQEPETSSFSEEDESLPF